MIHKRKRAHDFSDRHEYLGASEIGQAVGLIEAYGTDYDLWKQKTLRAPRTEHIAIFDRGHEMEPVMVRLLVGAGALVANEQSEASTKESEYLVSHLDGTVDFGDLDEILDTAIPGFAMGSPGVLELKAPGSRMASTFAKSGVHEHYIAQLQINIHNAGLTWGVVAWMDYDNWEMKFYFMEVDELLTDGLISAAEVFWNQVTLGKWDGSTTFSRGADPVVASHIKKHENVIGELENGSRLGELYLEALLVVSNAKSAMASTKEVIIDHLSRASITESFLGTEAKVKKVFNKGRTTYKGKALLAWTSDLVQAINDDDEEKALRMAEVFDGDPGLFISTGDPSINYKFTPSKLED